MTHLCAGVRHTLDKGFSVINATKLSREPRWDLVNEICDLSVTLMPLLLRFLKLKSKTKRSVRGDNTAFLGSDNRDQHCLLNLYVLRIEFCDPVFSL